MPTLDFTDDTTLLIFINRNRAKAAESAVRAWERYKQGLYPLWEDQRYSPEYCQTQIEYFTAKKQKHEKIIKSLQK